MKSNDNFVKDYLEVINEFLKLMSERSIESLEDITENIFSHKSELLGNLGLCLIKQNFTQDLEQEYYNCPCCTKRIRREPKLVKKVLETMIGQINLERPYFYCKSCKKGYYPLDEKMELAERGIQYDIQKLEAWLSSKLPYEEAQEAYVRCTGNQISTGHMFETTNGIADDIGIKDVCPSAEEIHQKLEQYNDQFRRPVVMIAVDGAEAPTRPEPSPYKGKRGKGQWRESKGFRIYIVGRSRIDHLISWHQIQTDDELAAALQTIKDLQLIPEEKVRLCFIGDGAKWIWNKISVIFPTAKQILDFYHCSEYIHKVAHLQYGKATRKAQEWVEATFARLFHNDVDAVLWGLERMQSVSDEAHEQINDTIRYLTNNVEKVNYRAYRKAGYHIGSGAIESANKFIGHVRLKRSGAWWYPSHANNILKLRCASYNGTFDRVLGQFKIHDQIRIRKKRAA
jgi:hypothetical protein